MPTFNYHAAPIPVLLIGGPVHNRRTNLGKQQVEEGYEFVDNGGGYGRNLSNDGPHSHWRSARYKRLTTIDGVVIMVHESVTKPSAWKFAEQLEHSRDDLKVAADKQEQLNREISEATSKLLTASTELVQLKRRLERVRKFNAMAQQLLSEVDEAVDV